MVGDGGSGQTAPVGEAARPRDVLIRSVIAFLVAPLIQNVVWWAAFISIRLATSTEHKAEFVTSPGIWALAAGFLMASYVGTATMGTVVHAMCLKLRLWKSWHYFVVSLIGGVVLSMLWGLANPEPPHVLKALNASVFIVTSSVTIALVVWVIVYWRNPQVLRTPVE